MSNPLEAEAENRKALVRAILNSELPLQGRLDILEDFESQPSAWKLCPNCGVPRYVDGAYCWFCYSMWPK